MAYENNKKGYLKIHVMGDVKTKEILSMKVTDDVHLHDSKALPDLVNGILKSNKKITIGKLIVDDDAYNDNEIFINLADNRIHSCIKVRKIMLEADEKRETFLEAFRF